ncbi:MAG: DUF4401 domain-containing protein [Halomonas sp.]
MTRETTPLITRLGQAGIPLNEHDTAASPEVPWFVRLLQAFFGWLTALFLLGFIALAAMPVVDSSAASMGLGLAMMGAAFGLLRAARSDVLEHLALAVSLVGQLLVAWAWVMAWEASAYLWWPLLGLQVVLALVMPSYVHRACSAFAASLALYMALAMSALEQSASGLVLLALTLLWLNEFRWPARIRNVQAWGYGLLVGLLVLQGIAHSGQPLWIGFEDHRIGTLGWLAPWLNTGLLALTLALLLHRVFKTQSRHWSAFAGVAALLLVSLYVPMVVQGVVVLLLGFAIGHRLLTGFGVLSLLVGMGSYYYWLDTTLLIKALVLLVIGVLLLILRWVLRKLLPVWHGSSTPREPSA